jgi:hypothetical protein
MAVKSTRYLYYIVGPTGLYRIPTPAGGGFGHAERWDGATWTPNDNIMEAFFEGQLDPEGDSIVDVKVMFPGAIV